jgi:hypothetical protein
VSSVSISSQPDIIAPIHYAEKCTDSRDKSHWCRLSCVHNHRHGLGAEELVEKS